MFRNLGEVEGANYQTEGSGITFNKTNTRKSVYELILKFFLDLCFEFCRFFKFPLNLLKIWYLDKIWEIDVCKSCIHCLENTLDIKAYKAYPNIQNP